MGYDPQFNKITWIRDSLGQTIFFSYDTQGNLLGVAYPDGSKENNTYDKDNRLTSSISADGKTTYYTYDDSRKTCSH